MSSLSNEADTVRAMLEHQENRLDERIKGLLALQGLLFAALGFSWDKVPLLPIIFSIVGVLASLALVGEAARSHAAARLIIEWWRQNRGDYVGPPVLESQLRVGSKFFKLDA